MQTTRLATSFEALTRSITCTGAKIFPCKAMCESTVFCEQLELTRTSNVKKKRHLNTWGSGTVCVSHVSCVTLHHHILPADWTRKVFKPSKRCGKSSVLDFLKLESSEYCFFLANIICGEGLGLFGRGHQALQALVFLFLSEKNDSHSTTFL